MIFEFLTDDPSEELQEMSRRLLFELGYPYKQRIKAKELRRLDEENNSCSSIDWVQDSKRNVQEK